MTIVDELRVRLDGRYEIERELGRGGMGAVYLARDVRLGRLVALKVLPAEFAAQPALRERFLRETRMSASFSHPNIVPVYAIEESDDLLAYVMGYVEGESLAERVNRAGPLGTRETVRLLQDVGYALAYANGRGVVHRDIKPDNIMIERATGRALVMDFGIARLISAPGPAAADGLTRVGEVVGTPEYMSPEQATGDQVDGRSDLYSLGLSAYFALTGRIAMAADSTGKALAKQITEVLPPMRSVRPDLPSALADAIDRCLLKDPDARFANAEGLVESLDAAQLATPEIPVAIRMFAQEAGTLSTILLGGAILVFLLVQGYTQDKDNDLDNVILVVLVLSVLVTRALQTRGEARRLVVDGFSVEGVNRGLAAVMAERQSRRDELRANAEARRRRQRTFRGGVAGLALAVASFRLALFFRVQTGPHHYSTSLPGVLLVLAAVLSFGVSLAMLVRSPFTMPIGERFFRAVWLGGAGRAFVRFAGRGVARAMPAGAVSQSAAVPAPAFVPTTAPGVPPATDRLAALERRVEALEQWRRGR